MSYQIALGRYFFCETAVLKFACGSERGQHVVLVLQPLANSLLVDLARAGEWQLGPEQEVIGQLVLSEGAIGQTVVLQLEISAPALSWGVG